MWGGQGFLFFFLLCSFRTIRRKKAVYLGQQRSHLALWNQPACILNMESGFLIVLSKRVVNWAFSPQLLAVAQLCKWQFSRITFSVIAQLCDAVQISAAEESCAWCSLDLVQNATQMCCCSSKHTFFGWVCPYNFSSQNSQYKSGSSASEVLLPDACSKTLA